MQPTRDSRGVAPPPARPGQSRGYLTTPDELVVARRKAEAGVEPYAAGMAQVLDWAERRWDYGFDRDQSCPGADEPAWIDNGGGVPTLYARALALHLTGEQRYGAEVKDALEQIMSRVETISLEVARCRLVFGWGTPELVAAADLIEAYWEGDTCTGPSSTVYGQGTIGRGDCKTLFQNWLAKNPYYVVSYSGISSQSNWGAAATNTMAHIADYLWDRSDVALIHRQPDGDDDYVDVSLTPAEAYQFANELALRRINGYGVELGSSSACDHLGGPQQSSEWEPVKSQITENGIVTEDARRDEFCNIPEYSGEYQNYPQIHLGNLVAQCELMYRRGDRSCYDNVDNSDIPEYAFTGPTGERKTTHLRPGRGSIERAINAVIVDSDTEWRHTSALEVAYRYYLEHHRLTGVEQWADDLDGAGGCSQDICFATISHGVAPSERPMPPPVVAPPGGG